MNDARKIAGTETETAAPSFLSGGGKMGALMRAHDWAKTPLGPVEGWPQSLRSAVSICLGTSFPIGIYWGPELALIYNDAWSPIPGNKHPWALGRPGREVWPEIWDTIGPLYERVQVTGEGVWQEDQLLAMHRHGYTEECYFNFTFSPIRGEAGKVEGIFNAVVETTFRVIGERRERALRELAESIAEVRSENDAFEIVSRMLTGDSADVPFFLLYRLDADGHTASLVRSAGLAADGPASPRSINLDDAGAPWPLARVVESGRAESVGNLSERFGFALHGGPWPEPVECALLAPIGATPASGGMIGFLVAGLNPRRALDDDYQAFVERAAGHLAIAIANARAYEEERKRAEALAEIDRAKTLFFSNVSHEFRTPLTLMLGPLEESLAQPDLPASERERVGVAHRNGMRLLKLVNSLLDFSRIEAGRAQANFEPTDLSGLTADLASNFRSATEKAGLALVVDCPPLPAAVHVDRDMWEKIVLNLLSNAFKFTFEGEIAVGLKPVDDAVELTIRDTGTGIPAHELPRLFERFHRIEGAPGRSYEGSGIGLALVQELVKLHGGSIRVDSEEGKGTVFTVTMPLEAAELPRDQIRSERQAASTAVRAYAYVEEALRWLPGQVSSEEVVEKSLREPEPGVPAGSESERARILLADDNVDMRDYVRRLLGSRHVVEAVPDGRAALDSMRQQRPDLLLTDVMMPNLDGFGLVRAVREDAALRDLPIIVLSARAGSEASVEGLSVGADDYLIKPFSARELIARVDSALNVARMRRQMGEALRESEARFRNMADNAPVMVWTTDPTGYCTYLSRSWYEFTGQTPETGLGFGWLDATHPDDKKPSEEIFLAANARREAFSTEYRLRRVDGTYRWAIDAAAPWFGSDGAFLGYIGSVIDITERKATEDLLQRSNEELERRVAAALAEQAEAAALLRQAQKMEAVGKLTGGVAHDFNNLLQVIGGNLQLLAKDLAGNEKAEQRLRNAAGGVARGAKLASQLLAFGRRQPLAPKVVNLGRLIRGMDDMLRRSLGEAIEVETVVAGGLWNTLVDPAQLENALLNLAINARDAMDSHGKLTIEAGNASLDDGYADRHAEVTPGQYVMLAVTDTGSGIAPEIMEHVFDPFFTTKREGEGTGLGLSMVYGFVKQSSGHIKIYSERSQGTTVRIYLPRTRQREDVASDIEAGPVAGGTETILVVEDDEDVRATVVEMLSDLGYRVLKARDADSALAIIESGVSMELLFTDVVMPGVVRSPDLARKARERIPGLAVLFTSGYTHNAIVHGGRLDDGVELLSKPYSREELARKVRHVLRNQQQRNAIRPAAQSPTAAGRRTVPEDQSGRSLRVLLVEDDVLIRLSTADMLSNLGHSVREAANASEALAVLDHQDMDVLLTDIGLPGISGDELAAQAYRRNPKLRVVFASGHDAPPLSREQQPIPNAVYLRKPYGQEGLAEALTAAMR